METININLADILKINTHPEAGDEVYKISYEAIKNENSISINMADVIAVPTSFMNNSFGKLINNFGYEKTRNSFYFVNIRKTQIERFRKYFEDFATTQLE